MARGVVMLALRETAGKTAHLADALYGVTPLSDDDTVTEGLAQLRADLKACRERARGLIERLERQGDLNETPA